MARPQPDPVRLPMKEDHFPVSSPELLESRYPLSRPADLARHTQTSSAARAVSTQPTQNQ
jgi:hypothetical protein